jgi:hypothetical protein
LHGPQPTSVDASIYGFIANIYFYPIETPLKQFVTSQDNLVRHCTIIHAAIKSGSKPMDTLSQVAPVTRGTANE